LRRRLFPPTLRGRPASLYDHCGGDVVVMLNRDRASHELDDFLRKERKHGRVRDSERSVPADPHICEPGSCKLLGEDTLRQGS
jgi:hypothetical protein